MCPSPAVGFLPTHRAQRVGHDLAWVDELSAGVTPGEDDVLAGNYYEHLPKSLVTRIAASHDLALEGATGLDPLISQTAEATHQ